MPSLRSSTRAKLLIVFPVALIIVLVLSGLAFSESLRGMLYLKSKVATLSPRIGTPCLKGEGAFCNQNYECPAGQVARGLIVNVDVHEEKPSLAGFGLTCAEPNEVFKTTEVGAFGDAFGGKVYKERCSAGFYLSGVTAYTDDRRNVGGVSRICRRYWPVEEKKGGNVFGSGELSEPFGCKEGEFVTGVKASFHRVQKDDGSPDTVLRNFRFYCSEMRHWVGTPEERPDPRDPETRK